MQRSMPAGSFLESTTNWINSVGLELFRLTEIVVETEKQNKTLTRSTLKVREERNNFTYYSNRWFLNTCFQTKSLGCTISL